MNTFGTRFRITTFGESHGPAVGVVVDGCPAGLALDEAFLQAAMARRRPGQSRLTTRRDEADHLEILSGAFQGRTTGAPLTLMVRNQDQRSQDYDHLATAFRPSHADYTYHAKYGHRDHRGGGRSSARETLARVAGGAIAQLLLRERVPQLSIHTWVHSVRDIQMPDAWPVPVPSLAVVEAHPTRCPDLEVADRMATAIEAARKAGDTLGGVVRCWVAGVPPGWGEPVFGKLHALLGAAILGINACKGFQYGSGFAGTLLTGSAHNDLFTTDDAGHIITETNHSGGIQGGISNGMPICFEAAFKPVATLLRPQPSVDSQGRPVVVEGRGRHDPCVLPRAVPIVEAMTALVLADAYLQA